MAATGQFSVGSGAATPVIAKSVCKNIRIMENRGVAGWPTTDYLIFKPTASATSVRLPLGSSYTFDKMYGSFAIGQTVGFVQTVAGSTTFDQDEDSSD